jgi:hypothetical protein
MGAGQDTRKTKRGPNQTKGGSTTTSQESQ